MSGCQRGVWSRNVLGGPARSLSSTRHPPKEYETNKSEIANAWLAFIREMKNSFVQNVRSSASWRFCLNPYKTCKSHGQKTHSYWDPSVDWPAIRIQNVSKHHTSVQKQLLCTRAPSMGNCQKTSCSDITPREQSDKAPQKDNDRAGAVCALWTGRMSASLNSRKKHKYIEYA